MDVLITVPSDTLYNKTNIHKRLKKEMKTRGAPSHCTIHVPLTSTRSIQQVYQSYNFKLVPGALNRFTNHTNLRYEKPHAEIYDALLVDL